MGKASILMLFLCAGFFSPAASAQDRSSENVAGDPDDSLPKGALARLGTLRWRQNYLSHVAFLPDGKSLIAGGRELRRWDIATGKVLRDYGPTAFAPFALSGDGKYLASRDYVRQADDGKVLYELKGREGILDVFAFSPKSELLAAGSREGMIFLWNVAGGKLVRKFQAHQSDVYCLAFSPDGKWLASGAGRTGQVRLWNVADGKQVGALDGHAGWVWSVAFSPDGKFLASVDSTTLRLWDPETGKMLHSRSGPQKEIRCVVFSPDGQTLATSGWESWDRTILLWDVVSFKFIRRCLGHQDGVLSLAFSPDGKTLASVSRDNTIRLWDPESGKQKDAGLGHQAPIEAITISPDNKLIASGGRDQTVHLWDHAGGEPLRSMERWLIGPVPTQRFMISGLAFSPDNKQLWSAAEKVRLFGLTTGRQQREFWGDQRSFTALALTGNGNTLAAGSRSGRIFLWNLATGTDPSVLEGRNSVQLIHNLAFSPDGKMLASGGANDRFVRLWEVPSGKELRHLGKHNWPVTGVAFSPDGHSLAACTDTSVLLWEPATGKERWRFQARDRIKCIAYSPDGRTLAAGGDDAIVWLVDIASGKVLVNRPGHRGKISALAFAPNGKTLVSGSHETTALIWDTADLLRNRLTPAELDAERLAKLWSTLAGDHADKAHQAIWTMIAGAEQTVPFLRKRLEKIPPVITPQIAKLLADLESGDFKTREKAAADLAGLGQTAEAALRQALTMKLPLEVRLRLNRLLEKIAGPVPPLTVEQFRVLRALEVLEQIGTPQARQVLQIVAEHGPEMVLRQPAQAAVERLKKRGRN